jgi:hypothetical protein
MLKNCFSSIIDKIKNISIFISPKKKEVDKENKEEKYYCDVDINAVKCKKIPLEKQMKLLYENIDTDLKNKAFFKSKVLFFLSKEAIDTDHNRFFRNVYAVKDYSKPDNNEEIQICPFFENLHCLNGKDVPKFEKFIKKFLKDLKEADMIVNVNQDSFLFLNILYCFIVFFKDHYIIDNQETQKFCSIYKEIKTIIAMKSANTDISCYGFINIKNEFSCFDLKVIEEYYYIAKYTKTNGFIDIEIDTRVKYNANNLEDNIKQLIYIFNNRCLLRDEETNNVQYAIKHILKRR